MADLLPGDPTEITLTRPAPVTLAAGGLRIHLMDAGLACCAVEFAAAMHRLPPDRAAGEPVRLNVLVVSGTVTDKLAPTVLDAYRELPEPRAVVSFGACANTGGPYWDSYSVTKGVDQMIPVDLYVPGCPPRPEALLAALDRLAGPDRSGPVPT